MEDIKNCKMIFCKNEKVNENSPLYCPRHKFFNRFSKKRAIWYGVFDREDNLIYVYKDIESAKNQWQRSKSAWKLRKVTFIF